MQWETPDVNRLGSRDVKGKNKYQKVMLALISQKWLLNTIYNQHGRLQF